MSGLISKSDLSIALAQYVTSNAYLNQTALDALRMVMRWVYEEPAMDAVEVVRCKECKYWSGRNDKPGEVTAIGYCDHPNHYIMPLRTDWYCADGAKMDGGREDGKA